MLQRQDYVELVLKFSKLISKGKIDKFALTQYQKMIEFTAEEMNLKTDYSLSLIELFDEAEKNHLDLEPVEHVYSMLRNMVLLQSFTKNLF
ncbi:hypothetical protein HMPREF2811_00525 [Globicatella sp. HMSC072A10]|uniref:hypothetical protein n=1 Tax=Globicatella sp. HMSC072A10 TaxID=1739315 RepID=UPI0008CBFDE8|nr:hypothetical protein [Globicatella sp. HMSC072A10]OFK59812.1 hypothetical protein HMPREF2811_00525 [Globicatella sp. HMSC072A10]